MPEPRPIPVLTAAQAAAWDERARVQASVPSRVLMEAAGRAAAGVIAREFRDRLGQGVVVAAGPGNNGGDGWVVARALHAAGVRVLATEAAKQRSADCEANRALALADGVTLLPPASPWPAAGLVVDALLGTGAGDAPRGPVGQLARRVAEHGAPVAAIDGPTGLDLSTGTAHGPVRATLTVTFGGARRGHLLARDWVGTLVVVDIGFPPGDPAWPLLATDAWAASVLPAFAPAMHKGDRGRVLVVGGDVGMAGAAMHAGRAAFACGAGLVKLALAEPSIRAAQTNLPDALTVTTTLGPRVERELEEAIAWADAIVLGPGLGRGDPRTRFALTLLERARAPVVIDADALQVPGVRSAGAAPRVLTPHPGEFAAQFPELAEEDRFVAPTAALELIGRTGGPGVRRSGQRSGSQAVRRSARRSGQRSAGPPVRRSALLLKGVPTVIASGSAIRVVAAGNPALATGGTGDVLAGTIAAWLARGLTPLDAATLGAHTMGRAAELAARERGARATRPEDVVAQYPRLWDQWRALPPPEPPVLLRLEPPAVS